MRSAPRAIPTDLAALRAAACLAAHRARLWHIVERLARPQR